MALTNGLIDVLKRELKARDITYAVLATFLVPLVTKPATKIAMPEKARPAIIKTMMEDAPIGMFYLAIE